MNDRMIHEAEKAYQKFEQKAGKIAANVMSRLKDFHCEVSCDNYKGDGLCVCFENLFDNNHVKNESLYGLDSFVVPVKSIPKRGNIDIEFVLKNSI